MTTRTTPPADTIKLRPAVQRFAERMELQLRANDHKGGWEDCDAYWLLSRASEEMRELLDALARLDKSGSVYESVDAANFLMMIADNLWEQDQ